MFKNALKLILAAALLYWLISSGKLDLSLIQKSFHVGPQWIFAILLLFGQFALGAYRYKLLLETKSQKSLSYSTIFSINYIGVFFSSVLPGAVTGDLIKLIYIKKLDEKFTKSFLVTITLFDRIMGLISLLFLSACFSLIYYSEIYLLSPQLSHVIKLNLLLFSGALVFMALLISPEKYQALIYFLIEKIPYIGSKIAGLLKQIFSLREQKKDVLKCFLIGVVCHFMSIMAFWIVSSPFLTSALPFQYAFTFIPIGMIAMAIPISPGGLGVGHVLFANLFSFVHIDNGASLFNLFYLCNLTVNFLGVIPYVLIGRKKLD